MDAGKAEEASNELVQSFLLVRRALGWLGFFLPLSLIVSGLLVDQDIQSSISAMYHTSSGDLLVGTMIAIAVFLWSYVGYQRRAGERLSDRLVSRLAALGAAGVALVPVSPACWIDGQGTARPDGCRSLRVGLGLLCLPWAVQPCPVSAR